MFPGGRGQTRPISAASYDATATGSVAVSSDMQEVFKKVFFPKQYPIKKTPHFSKILGRSTGWLFPTVSTVKMAMRRIVLPPSLLLLLSAGAVLAEFRRFDGPVNAAR